MKGSITPVVPKGETIWFEYNPSQFESAKEVNWAEINVPGLDFPLQQFVSGGLNKVSLALYFNADGYDRRYDVMQAVKALEALVEKSAEGTAPPVCLFSWGSFQFPCLIGATNVRYTMFSREGTVLEATVELSLRAYREKKIDVAASKPALREKSIKRPVFYGRQGSGSVFAGEDEGTLKEAGVLCSEGTTKEHEMQEGETLQAIAAACYGSPGFWRIIAFANQGKTGLPGELLNLPDPGNAQAIMVCITGFGAAALDRLGQERLDIKASMGVLS